MKRAIVIILVVLLVAGGGAGGLMMMGIVPNPFNPAPMGPALTGAEKAAAELAAANKFQPPRAAFDLVKVDDMIIPVIMEGHVTRRVFIIARLRVNEPANVTAVEDRRRVYQDDVLRDLVPYFQKFYLSNKSVNAEMVKARLTASAARVYGEMVPEVLLINVFEQASPRPR